jgi:hypothetical protein
MTIEEMFSKIEEKIKEANIKTITDIWNMVFPPEEYVKELINEEEEIVEEIRFILLDEISDYSARKMLKIYNTLMNTNISFENFLYD